MPQFPSASRLGHRFLEFFKAHHEAELECHNSNQFGFRPKHATHRYHELLTDVNNALEDILDLHGSGDEDEVIEIPKCMYEWALCDLHHQICLSFVGRHGSEASGNHRNKPVPHGTEPELTLAGTDPESDRDDCDGEGLSSRECADETGQQSDEDTKNDSNDDLNSYAGGDSDDNGDDENEPPSCDDACDLAEYDKEEVIQKDQVSQPRMQLIEDKKDNLRTLVTISSDNARSQSMVDQTQSERVEQANRMTPNPAGGHSSSSPFTPKNDALSVQHFYDIDLARRSSYEVHLKRSPGLRTLMTVTTISADPSYDKDVHTNEKAVRQRILEPFASKGHNSPYGEEGFVYAFRDNELPFIKIGHARDLEVRKAQIERTCGFVESMSLVAAVKVKAYKRLEQIIHQDLAPHRRFFDCACGESRNQNGFTRHQEYFEIDDNAALSTLQLWADFVERQPWESNPSLKQDTHLKSDWHAKILGPSRVEPSETHEYHERRVQRWREFLGIPAPESKIEKGNSISPFALRSTAQMHNADAGPTKIFTPDYTPSKPPRSAPENIPEADKSIKSNLLFSQPQKRSSSLFEPTDRTYKPDSQTESHQWKLDLPDRTKDCKPMFDGPPDSTASNVQTKSVPMAGQQSSQISSDMSKTQLDASVQSESIRDKTPSAVNGLLSGLKLVDATVPQKPSVDRGQFADIQFSPVWKQPDESSGLTATPSSTMNSEHQNNKVNLTVGSDFSRAHEHHDKAQPIGAEFSPSQKAQKSGIMMSTRPHVQSMFELATFLLAKEVRPSPARAISADIWQFRWPLACSLAFALHSPYVPAGLSFFMWSVFLPFFVAELRGWTVADHA